MLTTSAARAAAATSMPRLVSITYKPVAIPLRHTQCQRMKNYSMLQLQKWQRNDIKHSFTIETTRTQRNQQCACKRKETNGATTTKRNQWCNDKHEETNGATTNKEIPMAQQQINRPRKRNDEHKNINGATTNKKNPTAQLHRETASRTVITHQHQITNQINIKSQSPHHKTKINIKSPMKTLFRKQRSRTLNEYTKSENNTPEKTKTSRKKKKHQKKTKHIRENKTHQKKTTYNKKHIRTKTHIKKKKNEWRAHCMKMALDTQRLAISQKKKKTTRWKEENTLEKKKTHPKKTTR